MSITDNMISYLAELWDNLTDKEWNYQWQNVIGMTVEQMKDYDLKR